MCCSAASKRPMACAPATSSGCFSVPTALSATPPCACWRAFAIRRRSIVSRRVERQARAGVARGRGVALLARLTGLDARFVQLLTPPAKETKECARAAGSDAARARRGAGHAAD